jgi:hypothetical protein
MRTRCEKEQLLTAVQIVQKATAAKTTLPILTGIYLSASEGFLELQANHAHNRFYNELEEWLSGITELTPGSTSATDLASRQLTTAVYEMQRAVADLSDKLGTINLSAGHTSGPGDGAPGPGPDEAVKDLARGVNQLVTLMRSEQKVVREWVDEQASHQAELAGALKALADNFQRRTT